MSAQETTFERHYSVEELSECWGMSDDFVRRQVVSDPHSPRQFRVNGPAHNIDAWYASFDVKPGEKLYLAPDQRVHIW